ncbi:cell division protein ZapC [Catenovulum sp. SM1970]|uniref:cell division protein ZapC domain-containing protein n=1 Tax=Marinifaba aquimaris TaxID=2741323 RepID=UPI001573C00E|nr:cell division protein ZapC domain-containing protein [Marinifaba aquimaris]NTS78723.1 cell division protein ZapC [Marinifaba aquimaris]
MRNAMLQANPKWKWHFDIEQGQLMLDMDEMMFVVAAKKSKLLDEVKKEDIPFSVEDCDSYTVYYHALEDVFDLAEPILTQMALNATALVTYSKPMGAKSWFVNPNTGDIPDLFEQVVTLTSDTQQGLFLLLERANESSLLMLLNPSFELNGGSQMKQFELIRVINDRLGRYVSQ